jgi:hypothetical protein
MIPTLASNGCQIVEGTIVADEEEHVPKGTEFKDKRGNPVKLTFVQGIILKGP